MILNGQPALFISVASIAILALTAQASTLDQARQDELTDILLQDCGSCHGMTLKGGLGPALTTEALAGKHEIYLQQTISEGHPGTPMPPWKELLSKDDIAYLVRILKQGVNQ